MGSSTWPLRELLCASEGYSGGLYIHHFVPPPVAIKSVNLGLVGLLESGKVPG